MIKYPKRTDGKEYDDDVKQRFNTLAYAISKIVDGHVPEVKKYIIDKARDMVSK